jgi:hypothetical protein
MGKGIHFKVPIKQNFLLLEKKNCNYQSNSSQYRVHRHKIKTKHHDTTKNTFLVYFRT